MRSSANVQLHVVEIAFGERPFEVSTASDVQLRTSDVLWHKENAINIAVSRLPHGWKYAAYVDGDFCFSRQDWALEAIHQLQLYRFVQLYSNYAYLSPEHVPIRLQPSFAFVYRNYENAKQGGSADGSSGICIGPDANGKRWRHLIAPGATGGAWAFRRSTFEGIGGLLDICVTGSADWHAAFGLTGEPAEVHPEMRNCGKAYCDAIETWQQRAYEVVRGNIGYVSGHCSHHWHGSTVSRGYGTRWHLLRDFDFDPATDIVRDANGLWKWAGNKPKLADAVTQYFQSRNEDSIAVVGEYPLL